MKNLKAFGVGFVVLLILYWIFKHNLREQADRKIPNTPGNVGGMGVPYNPHSFWGKKGKPFMGFSWYENTYMPLFGFVGYSSYGTE